MGATKRRFTLEFRIEAAHRVIDSGRTVREVAQELSLVEHSLYKWVRDGHRLRGGVQVPETSRSHQPRELS